MRPRKRCAAVLRMKSYIDRTVDRELSDLISGLPAVSIEGARGVGKTETAGRIASTTYRLDVPSQLAALRGNPDIVTEGPFPVLIDEWQRMPEIWDVVRRAVDDDISSTQRYLLTGSSRPSSGPTHSGAGRIVDVRMRPMSLAERGVDAPTVSMAALLSGYCGPVSGRTTADLGTYVDEIMRSGLPGAKHLSGRPLRTFLSGYITRLTEHDVDQLGAVVRNKAAMRRWLGAYSMAVSGNASYAAILRAAEPGTGDLPSRDRIGPYTDILRNLWIIDEVPAWRPRNNPLKNLGEVPVRQLVDPAIAVSMWGCGRSALLRGKAGGGQRTHRDLRNGNFLGALFESLVTQSVRVYSQHNEARVFHLRNKHGTREVDLIVERQDGRVLALEVKLSTSPGDKDVRHLHWLREEIGDDLLDAAVIYTGDHAYRRQDGIAVIPAALLGP